MKKLITTALIAATITSSAFASSFTDVPKEAWYASDLNSVLTDARMLVTGYPDGTFKPDMGFTVEQFAAIMVKASDVTAVPADASGDWAAPWVKKAKELGYIKDGEFASTARPITRGEMARIIVRYTETHEKNTYNNPESVKKIITDYTHISATLQPYVVKVYDLGIIGGYPDGTFGADKSLKRSEAVAVVSKIVLPSRRLGVKIDFSKLNQVSYEEAINTKVLDADEKWLFRNSTFYTGTLEQLNINFKYYGYSGYSCDFEYDGSKGIRPIFAVDNTGVYHLGRSGGVPKGWAEFSEDDGKGSAAGRTLVQMIFMNTKTNQVVVVPCNYKLVK